MFPKWERPIGHSVAYSPSASVPLANQWNNPGVGASHWLIRGIFSEWERPIGHSVVAYKTEPIGIRFSYILKCRLRVSIFSAGVVFTFIYLFIHWVLEAATHDPHQVLQGGPVHPI